MHGLILAAGEGSRLAADGVREPKPLIRIGGQPQVARLCETLDALGCETVTCMVRRGVRIDPVLKADGHRRVVACATPTSLHTLALGLESVPQGAVLCAMVDTVMPWESWSSVWMACDAALDLNVPAVIAIAPPSERERQPLYVEVDEDGWVQAIGAEARGTDWCTAGVYGFAPATRSLTALAVAEGMQRVRAFLARLAATVCLRAIPVVRALDVDHRADLDEAQAWAPPATP